MHGMKSSTSLVREFHSGATMNRVKVLAKNNSGFYFHVESIVCVLETLTVLEILNIVSFSPNVMEISFENR